MYTANTTVQLNIFRVPLVQYNVNYVSLIHCFVRFTSNCSYKVNYLGVNFKWIYAINNQIWCTYCLLSTATSCPLKMRNLEVGVNSFVKKKLLVHIIRNAHLTFWTDFVVNKLSPTKLPTNDSKGKKIITEEQSRRSIGFCNCD